MLGLCATRPAPADDAAAAQKPPGKFASQANYARQRAAYARSYAAEIIARMAPYDDIAKEDAATLQKATDAEVAVEEQEAAAYDAGDEAAAQQLQVKADRASEQNEVWKRRLNEWRRRQGEVMPTEASAQGPLSWMRQGLEGDYFALIKAKRAAAAAWGRVAEADYPGSDQVALYALQDQAMAADAEVEIANWRFQWAQQRSEILYNKTPETPEVRQSLDEVQRLLEQRIQARRDVLEPERRAREAEREMRLAEPRLRKAAEAAREQHEREVREERERAQRERGAAGK